MYLLDVNVVLALHRDDHVHHEPVRRWFEGITASRESFTVPTGVWHSYVRLITHRRVFRDPTPLVDAFAFIELTRAQAHHVATTVGGRHLEILRRMATDAAATGDLVPDVVLAAMAFELGARVVTVDRDFARFGVDHLRPPGC